jgi:integrase
MASVQARHARGCAIGRPWTPFAHALDGCTCPGGPNYFVAIREGRKLHRERVGKNRRQAERALTKVQGQVDEGEFRPLANVRFAAWGERWLKALERKETTRDAYRSTIAYATEAFGDRFVRRLGPADVSRFSIALRDRGVSDSTRAKHLRVLGACLSAAVSHGFAARNPVRELPRSERPRPVRKEAAYFEADELPSLFAKLPAGVYRVLVEVALKTGMRLGELLALTWGDVDLLGAVVRVRRTYTDGHESEPKNHERRDVDLTPDLVDLLGAWWGELGRPEAPETLVFPGETPSGYLSATTVLRRELYPAMKRAEVPRVGPTGEKRTFHSLRHTYAKTALENGRPITWLSRHLGHSSILITDGVYGHFERAARKREVAQMEGAFGV